MRRRMIIGAGVALILTTTFSCRTFQARDAVAVNDAVVTSHQQLMADFESFIHALDSRDADAISEKLAVLKNSAAEGQAHIGALKTPDCNTKFLPAARHLFEFYHQAAEDSYTKIARYYSLDSISYEAFDSLRMLVDEIGEAQAAADRIFLDAQQAFADQCGFKLVQNVD